jgi:hypothetical protein
MAAAAPPAPPGPRRVHLDATGWSLLRAAAGTLGLPVERLPDTAGDPTREPEIRQVLADRDLLDDRGRPSRSVHAALAVLTTAPITLAVERIEAAAATQAVWRTAGAPTAGVVVRDRLDAARDGGQAWRGIELQLLEIDDLLDLVVDELATADAPTDDGREPVEVPADDPSALPSGLVVEGQLVARAAVTVDGPGGTTLAQLLGDGTHWWQVGSSGPGRLRLLPVRAATLRASLVDALTQQLTAARAAGEGAGG